MKPPISVILPVYNGERYLAACLDSLLAQSLPPLEILAVNDGSRDGSGEILAEYAGKHPAITVLTQENRGVSAARNAALEIARGEYVAFMDSDDVAAPDFLEVLAAGIDGADISCSGLVRFADGAQPVWQPASEGRLLTGEEMYAAVTCDPECAGYPWNKLFRRSVIGSVRFPENIAILEDEAFVLEVLAACRGMYVCNAVTYGYRDNPTGARNSALSDRIMTNLLGRERILEILRTTVTDRSLWNAAWNELMRSYAISYKKLLFSGLDSRKRWMQYIREGFRRHWSAGRLDDGWSLKEKGYCFLLYLASRISNNAR